MATEGSVRDPGPRPSLLRVLGALALSGILGGVLVGAVFTALKLIQDGQGLAGLGTGLVLYSLIAIGFALPSAVGLGGPAYWLLSRGRTIRFWPVVLCAGAIASLPLLLLGLVGWGSGADPEASLSGMITLAVLLFVLGGIGGLMFWRLSGLHRQRAPAG
ncbi:hypothetical protein [Arenimonas sp.]|uniref:hypothetical protein n=1 Tax=Arenimonas sp. TaxID=1872635 RepID=UPI002E31214F|nr:hypothetical protein [Arenimonas sp.]HEX4853205.1 hypothetical protein [Arenimonas sp.]